MVVRKQGSYLEENRGSGGIRSELGLIGGQSKCFFLPYILTLESRVNLELLGGGEDLQPLVCPSTPLEDSADHRQPLSQR